jgi:hypothetical protein
MFARPHFPKHRASYLSRKAAESRSSRFERNQLHPRQVPNSQPNVNPSHKVFRAPHVPQSSGPRSSKSMQHAACEMPHYMANHYSNHTVTSGAYYHTTPHRFSHLASRILALIQRPGALPSPPIHSRSPRAPSANLETQHPLVSARPATPKTTKQLACIHVCTCHTRRRASIITAVFRMGLRRVRGCREPGHLVLVPQLQMRLHAGVFT